LTHLTWDNAAANSAFDDHLVAESASTTVATAAGADLYSNFSSPELDFDLAPCIHAFATPLFDTNYYPPAPSFSLPVPPLSSATTSLSNTPATANPPSPSPTPPSPDGGNFLIPGLKLPHTTKTSSKPGRRPAGASLSHTTEGRITKRSSDGVAATAPSVVAALGATDDVDPEVLDKRHRNNLAAKRYRQKKIDRIEELENEVKEVKQERDDLRIQLARQEAEVAALREMLKMKNSKGSKD